MAAGTVDAGPGTYDAGAGTYDAGTYDAGPGDAGPGPGTINGRKSSSLSYVSRSRSSSERTPTDPSRESGGP